MIEGRFESPWTLMNYEAVEETIRAGYRKVTPQYRRDDEVEVTTANYRRVRAELQRICDSFGRPIRVLDVGCGTGRYFHCLTHVRELVGIDITEEMLRAAAHPVRQEEISAESINLIRGNVYLTDFPPGSFDFIYSLGMFGNGCPVTAELCNKFHHWLAPGGRLFFNTVDVAGMPFWFRARRQVRDIVYSMLAQQWKQVLDAREARHPFFGMTLTRLEQIIGGSRFERAEVTSHICESPLWNGRHLECLAAKGAES